MQKWQDGKVNGSRGINAKAVSRPVIRYIKDKNGNACSVCHWSKKNTVTGQVPLEIDHIDGNPEHNQESRDYCALTAIRLHQTLGILIGGKGSAKVKVH